MALHTWSAYCRARKCGAAALNGDGTLLFVRAEITFLRYAVLAKARCPAITSAERSIEDGMSFVMACLAASSDSEGTTAGGGK